MAVHFTRPLRVQISSQPSRARGKTGAQWRTGRGKPVYILTPSRLIYAPMGRAVSVECVSLRMTDASFARPSRALRSCSCSNPPCTVRLRGAAMGSRIKANTNTSSNSNITTNITTTTNTSNTRCMAGCLRCVLPFPSSTLCGHLCVCVHVCVIVSVFVYMFVYGPRVCACLCVRSRACRVLLFADVNVWMGVVFV